MDIEDEIEYIDHEIIRLENLKEELEEKLKRLKQNSD